MNIVGAVIMGAVAIGCFVAAYMQYRGKGFLFNNAYLYASNEEQDSMDKKPYYRQSAICIFLIGVIFVINAVDMIVNTDWLIYCVIGVVVVELVYAVVSTVRMEKSKKH